jgi:hypothetical protein
MDEQVNIPALLMISDGETHLRTLSAFLAIGVEKPCSVVGKSATIRTWWSKFGSNTGNSGKVSA